MLEDDVYYAVPEKKNQTGRYGIYRSIKEAWCWISRSELKTK